MSGSRLWRKSGRLSFDLPPDVQLLIFELCGGDRLVSLLSRYQKAMQIRFRNPYFEQRCEQRRRCLDIPAVFADLGFIAAGQWLAIRMGINPEFVQTVIATGDVHLVDWMSTQPLYSVETRPAEVNWFRMPMWDTACVTSVERLATKLMYDDCPRHLTIQLIGMLQVAWAHGNLSAVETLVSDMEGILKKHVWLDGPNVERGRLRCRWSRLARQGHTPIESEELLDRVGVLISTEGTVAWWAYKWAYDGQQPPCISEYITTLLGDTYDNKNIW